MEKNFDAKSAKSRVDQNDIELQIQRKTVSKSKTIQIEITDNKPVEMLDDEMSPAFKQQGKIEIVNGGR